MSHERLPIGKTDDHTIALVGSWTEDRGPPVVRHDEWAEVARLREVWPVTTAKAMVAIDKRSRG